VRGDGRWINFAIQALACRHPISAHHPTILSAIRCQKILLTHQHCLYWTSLLDRRYPHFDPKELPLVPRRFSAKTRRTSSVCQKSNVRTLTSFKRRSTQYLSLKCCGANAHSLLRSLRRCFAIQQYSSPSRVSVYSRGRMGKSSVYHNGNALTPCALVALFFFFFFFAYHHIIRGREHL